MKKRVVIVGGGPCGLAALKEMRASEHETIFDVIVLCTGFFSEYPWLKLKDFNSNPRSWYLHCFPEGLGHCLFFVGYARPHQGGIPAMTEMLSRYIGLLLRGERRLPFDYPAQARRHRAAEREHYFISPNLHALVDYNAFIESVARRVGRLRAEITCVQHRRLQPSYAGHLDASAWMPPLGLEFAGFPASLAAVGNYDVSLFFVLNDVQ